MASYYFADDKNVLERTAFVEAFIDMFMNSTWEERQKDPFPIAGMLGLYRGNNQIVKGIERDGIALDEASKGDFTGIQVLNWLTWLRPALFCVFVLSTARTDEKHCRIPIKTFSVVFFSLHRYMHSIK